MTKELSYVTLELHNVRIEPSNVRKKIREQLNVTKKLLHMKLKLHIVMIESSNVRKKSKGITKCDKKIVTFDVRTAQYENKTIKCEEKNILI